ncbi:hypothetical protein AAP_04364 [Ascosphaera apis ARSEF 7405]|uniref:Uncharacterized protein n=1 Tax=Ascosphaera apis ARSEF 7405 TaxID=392613 RepID=A0A167X470_9EURO|nr:hypothetical protein AAP_04364 [Ascosphaera apis ARSEF 7405]
MPQSGPGSRKAGSTRPEDPSMPSATRSKPKKTARFATSGLKSTRSTLDRRGRSGQRTDDQTTLTQIDFIRLSRPLYGIDWDEIEKEEAGEVPGSLVHRHNHSGPNENEPESRRKKRKATATRNIRKSPVAFVKGGNADDTLTQMGFVRPTPCELEVDGIEDDEMGISPTSRGRSMCSRSNGTHSNARRKLAGRTGLRSHDVETAESPTTKRGRSPEGHISAPPERSGTPLQECDGISQEPDSYVTPQKTTAKTILPLRTPPSAVSTLYESPAIAETPQRIVEEESPTKRRSTRNRHFLSARTMKIEDSPSSVRLSGVPMAQGNTISLCSSSVQATSQSSLNDMVAGDGMRRSHTPDTSPATTLIGSANASRLNPQAKAEKTQQPGSFAIADSFVQDTFGHIPEDDRCIPNSQTDDEEDHDLLVKLLDETPPHSSRRQPQEAHIAIKRESSTQGSGQTSLLSSQHTIIKHESHTQSQSLNPEHAQEHAAGTTNQSSQPSLLYARRQPHVSFDPMTSEIQEIDTDRMRALFPSSPQRRIPHSKPQTSDGKDVEGAETQSDSCPSSDRHRKAKAHNSVRFTDRNEEIISTEFAPDSSDAAYSEHAEFGRFDRLRKPEECFPSSPPAVLVPSSQQDFLHQNDDDTIRLPNVLANDQETRDKGKRPPDQDDDDENTAPGDNNDSKEVTQTLKPITVSQLLPSSLLSWPKPLFELDGYVWNGDTHVRLSQLPEDEAEYYLEKGRRKD